MTLVGEKLQVLAERLDLKAALDNLQRNDLLPPRVEDKVQGQLRQGFLEGLTAAIADGSYRPLPADRVLVPKPRFASRPASLLSLEDRLVYSSLVSTAGDKIERVLDDSERVFWPRGKPAPGRWKEFEKAPLAVEPSHIVLADVAGFYESVDHARLRRVLIRVVGSTPLADAICVWLGEVMGGPRGIPQGYSASDHLATVYLADADAAVARAGFLLHRHGDDIRIPVHDYPDALRAAHVVEQGLRQCQLLPNSSKLTIETIGKYRTDLGRTDADAQRLREQLESDAAERLLEEGKDEDVFYLLERLGFDVEPTGGYREGIAVGPDDVAELAAMLTPTTAEQAWAMLDDGMRRRPGGGGDSQALSNEHFHERVAGALPVLAGAKGGKALVHCEVLLTRYAEETALVASYLAAMAADQRQEVQKICAAVLGSDTFMLGWQRAWLWNTLANVAPVELDEGIASLAQRAAESDRCDWIERLEATKLLAAIGSLERQILLTLWQRAPTVYRADLIAAAVLLQFRSPEDWPRRFLATAKQDPIHTVVESNIKNSARVRTQVGSDLNGTKAGSIEEKASIAEPPS
ncbi:MAG TPA: hypothetical protein VF657_22150 [Actinoplanes sp.]|jgi:hypothetical protein